IRVIKFGGITDHNQSVSLKFYTEALGLKIVTDQPFTDGQRWIELLIPGAETGLALYTPEGHERRIGEFQSIAFWCDDVFATAKHAEGQRRHFCSGTQERVLRIDRHLPGSGRESVRALQQGQSQMKRRLPESSV